MPVFPDVGSTIVLRPGSMRPSASAASSIATPIRSLTLPAGLCDSSFPISSASQSGTTRVSRTIGVLPIRSARLSGIALVGGETLIPPPRVPARCALLAERDEGHADDRRLVRLGAHAEDDAVAGGRALRRLHEGELEGLIVPVVDPGAGELRLDLRDRRADAHPARLRAAADADAVNLPRVRERVLDGALERGKQVCRPGVRGELTALLELADLP